MFPKWSLSFKYSDQYFVSISYLFYAYCMPHPYDPPWVDHRILYLARSKNYEVSHYVVFSTFFRKLLNRVLLLRSYIMSNINRRVVSWLHFWTSKWIFSFQILTTCISHEQKFSFFTPSSIFILTTLCRVSCRLGLLEQCKGKKVVPVLN